MKNNNNLLHKDLNLAFAYLFIFIVGLIIVTSMIAYINSKVNEITSDYTLNGQ